MSNKAKINSKGVTLIEVLIATVVLLIVFLGLLQTSLLSIDHNLRNEVRNEAVKIASKYMALTRATKFTDVIATYNPPVPPVWVNLTVWAPLEPPVTRNFRNLSFTYTVERSVGFLDNDNKQIGIRVSWTYRTENLTHTIFASWRSRSD